MSKVSEKTYEGHVPGLYLALYTEPRHKLIGVGLGDRAIKKGVVARIGLSKAQAQAYIQDLLEVYKLVHGEEFKAHERDIDIDPN